MPADSNIPVLGRIAAAIHLDPNHYADGRDYYGSPVHTALERALDDHSWPHVRKEYLFDANSRLTKFPHNERLPDAEERDLPATFFYEFILLVQEEKIGKRKFSTECVNYYESQDKNGKDKNGKDKNGKDKNDSWSEKSMRDHARKMFFNCYAFILCQEIVKNNIKVDQLKSASNDPPQNDGIGKDQHDFYINKIHGIYCKRLRAFDAVIPRFNDYNRTKFNRNPVLSGPIFMTKIFDLNFVSNADRTYLKIDKDIDFSNVGNRTASKLDFEKRGGKNAAALFIFCAAAERALLEKECCSPLEKVEELIRDTQDVSNFLSRKAIMPDIQQTIDRTLEELIKVVRAERDSRATRFAASGLLSDIQAFIISGPPEDPDSIEEFGSLHVVVPNEIPSLLESVIELKFHFFDINKIEQAFHYIEAYSCDDQFGRPSDGYYFVPGSDNSLPESDYLSCEVKVGTIPDPKDETTAHVVALLYRPDISF